MKEFLLNNMQWFLIISIFLTRIIDIFSTYVVSPKLILETNPIVRKFKWPAAVFTIILALLPFASINLGIVILTLSLISSSLNIRKIWMMRTVGEKKSLETIIECVNKNGIAKISVFEFLSSLFWIFLAMFLLLMNNDNEYIFWFAVSLCVYGLLSFVYYIYYLFSIQKKYLAVENSNQ